MSRLGRRFQEVGSKFWRPVTLVVAWVVCLYFVVVRVRALWFHAYLHNHLRGNYSALSINIPINGRGSGPILGLGL